MATTKEKIIELLRRPGVTRKSLAESINVTESHISRILNEQRAVSRKIDKAIDELLEGKDERKCKHPNPTIEAVIKMMESMDADTQEDVRLSVQKEKLLRELIREKQEKEAA